MRRAFGHYDGGLESWYGKFLRYFQAGRRLANSSVRRSPSLEVMLVDVWWCGSQTHQALTCCFLRVNRCHTPSSLLSSGVSYSPCSSPFQRRASWISLPMASLKGSHSSQFPLVLEIRMRFPRAVGFPLLFQSPLFAL
jgi:hypothetical protein